MTSGNVSGRDPETNLVVIKPSGISFEALTPADLVIVDLQGNVVEGTLEALGGHRHPPGGLPRAAGCARHGAHALQLRHQLSPPSAGPSPPC